MTPKCHICGKPAACVGQYESMTALAFACDECCGHGCEDGECWRLASAPAPVEAELRCLDCGATPAESFALCILHAPRYSQAAPAPVEGPCRHVDGCEEVVSRASEIEKALIELTDHHMTKCILGPAACGPYIRAKAALSLPPDPPGECCRRAVATLRPLAKAHRMQPPGAPDNEAFIHWAGHYPITWADAKRAAYLLAPPYGLCDCGHMHAADSDGGDGGCRDAECECVTWRAALPLPGAKEGA